MKSFYFILMMLTLFIIALIKSSFLMFLISLEFFTLINLMIILMFKSELSNWLFMYYLIMSVCEMVIGVSIMISLQMYFGHESLMKLSLSGC